MGRGIKAVAEFMMQGMTAEQRDNLASHRIEWIAEAELQIAMSDGISQSITGAEVIDCLEDMIAEDTLISEGDECPFCKGGGKVLSVDCESEALDHPDACAYCDECGHEWPNDPAPAYMGSRKS